MIEYEMHEVVKEFDFYVDYENIQVLRGKVLKTIKPDLTTPYSWKISHYYKPSDSAISVYRPSSMFGHNSISEAEQSLIRYVEGFTGIDIEENEYY